MADQEINIRDVARNMREQVQEELASRAGIGSRPTPDQVRAQITGIVQQRARYLRDMTSEMVAELCDIVVDDIVNYGAIQQLIDDPDVSDILVDGPGKTFVEVRGKKMPCPLVFSSDDDIRWVINKILRPLNRTCDEMNPQEDGNMPDGSRIHATVPPVTPWPTLSIRKFRNDMADPESLLGNGTMSQDMMDFLAAAVRARCNILISGGTGSGKTTLLNVLSGFVFPDERIITCEDARELKIKLEDWVPMQSKPANADGAGGQDIEALLKGTLRMRPDRIIIGEVRGKEASDMIQAMNTGHDGSIGTIHASSPERVMIRLQDMILQAHNLPIEAIRNEVSMAIDLIVHSERFYKTGERKVLEISAPAGMEGGTMRMQKLFEFELDRYEEDRIVGRHVPCGYMPPANIQRKFLLAGEELERDWFSGGSR